MKTTLLKTWCFLGLLLISCSIFAQSNDDFRRTDVVYLKNGSIFRGQIEYYDVDTELRLRMDVDNVVVFDAKNIKRIVQESTTEESATTPIHFKKTYDFKEKGLYYALNIGYIGGNSFFGNYTDAYNVHFQSGYQFHRLLGAGVGAGVDFYNVNLGSIIPVYVEARGYLRAKNVSPYYHVAAGMGFPVLSDNNNSFDSSKGGYYLAPGMGVRFGGSAESNLTIGLALQWQKASYTQNFGDGISKNVDKYTFRRFTFKIGVLF